MMMSRRAALMSAGKAYAITNDVANGNFSNGSTGWTLTSGATVETVDGKTCLQALSSGTRQASQNKTNVVGHKYYISFLFKSSTTFTSYNTWGAIFEWYKTSTNTSVGIIVDDVQVTVFTKFTDVQTAAIQGDIIRSKTISGSTNCWYTDLLIVDLTAAFGAGNEPDKAWCDANISFFNGTMTIYK